MTADKKARILISSGEPAGIGPDLIVQISKLDFDSDITVLIDPKLLKQRADIISNISSSIGQASLDKAGKGFNVFPIKLNNAVTPGVLDSANADYVLNMLNIACVSCMEGDYDALVTAPLQKSIINIAGKKNFTGHTEYLANRCKAKLPVMMLCCSKLRVAFVTTHVPLRKVAEMVSFDRVKSVLDIIIQEFPIRFGIKKPKIVVCGLNPHAGEGGYLGNEEQDYIIPVVTQLKKEGHNIIGPVSADTAFRNEIMKTTDVYLCMYHDQGLPVLKTIGFGEAVNITLGLPIIRTSVDHGTALELAGSNNSNIGSLLKAINMAEKMVLDERHFFNNV